jgi:hypothetical protein
VDTSLPGVRVVRVLDRLTEIRSLPLEIVLDNCPEMNRARQTDPERLHRKLQREAQG